MTDRGCDMRAVWKMLDEYEALAKKPKVFIGKSARALIYPPNCAHGILGVEPRLDG
jgi:hypothetical protein